MSRTLLEQWKDIAYDDLFIYTLDMGVEGAAIATAISQMVSTLVYLTYVLRKKSVFSFSIKIFSPTRQMMAEILKIGVPTLVFHVLALEGSHAQAVLRKHTAQPRRKQALPRVRHGALDHDGLRPTHGYRPPSPSLGHPRPP